MTNAYPFPLAGPRQAVAEVLLSDHGMDARPAQAQG
jgi:hypothetical protein